MSMMLNNTLLMWPTRGSHSATICQMAGALSPRATREGEGESGGIDGKAKARLTDSCADHAFDP